MKTHTDVKIEEAYDLALKLGLQNASEFEKDVFKSTLKQIAVSAIDELRKKAEDLMHNEAGLYTFNSK